MVSIIYQIWIVYLIPTVVFLWMDYQNIQQVSHYLFYDLTLGIVPALLYGLWQIHRINEIQKLEKVE